MVEKPVNLLIEDTRRDVISVLNNSRLPLAVISLILKDASNGVEAQLKQQVDAERNQYMAALQKEQTDATNKLPHEHEHELHKEEKK
jgi:hypothetical protein